MHPFLLYIFLLFVSPDQSFRWVSFDMTKRSAQDGKMSRVDARIAYKASGEMVTHFQRPKDVYILNNSLGDVQIYNAKKNELVRTLDNRMGSQNTTFFYLLLGNTGDLGLEADGFTLRNSRVEDMMLISEYDPPKDSKNQVQYAELVSNGEHPVFTGYIGESGEYLKKVYYYNYENVGGTDFPMSITEIDFAEGDSVVTKTTFSNFGFDDPEDKALADFQVPSNATLLK